MQALLAICRCKEMQSFLIHTCMFQGLKMNACWPSNLELQICFHMQKHAGRNLGKEELFGFRFEMQVWIFAWLWRGIECICYQVLRNAVLYMVWEWRFWVFLLFWVQTELFFFSYLMFWTALWLWKMWSQIFFYYFFRFVGKLHNGIWENGRVFVIFLFNYFI